MAKAVLCPVCGGEGEIYEKVAFNPSTGSLPKKTCHGCGGKGWVEVAEDMPVYYPSIPCSPPYYPYPSTGDPIPPETVYT